MLDISASKMVAAVSRIGRAVFWPALLPLLCALCGITTAQAQLNYEPYSFSTFAGTGPGNVDSTGSAARFFTPAGVAFDTAGNLYVADFQADTIRKITPGATVSTIAGSAGTAGSVDGSGSAARFNGPAYLALDSAGNIFVADSGNHTIRKITPAGVVSTLAGSPGVHGSSDGTGKAATFNDPRGLAIDTAGHVYVSDSGNNTIRKITPAGVVSTLAGSPGVPGTSDGTGKAAAFSAPAGIAIDSAGNIYVVDSGNDTVRKITSPDTVSTLAGSPGVPGSSDGIGKAATFNVPAGIAVDGSGNLYVADNANDTMRQIAPDGTVSTIAGVAGVMGSSDGAGAAARFYLPQGVAVDQAGSVYVGDSGNNTVRQISRGNVVSTFAGAASIGSVDGTGAAARFYSPRGIAVDSSGNVYVADSSNDTIRKITSSGLVSTLAGSAGVPGSNDGSDGNALFSLPGAVAIDSAGSLYVADSVNSTIRKITPAGGVSTLAGLAGSPGSSDGTSSIARFSSPEGIAIDNLGNIYVADYENNTIRKITLDAVVSTVAGLAGASGGGSTDGPASSARFSLPGGVAVDSEGDIYVADTFNSCVRKITRNGVVSTLAGLAGAAGFVDGRGSAARFRYPSGVAVDKSGHVYVADIGNNSIRKITPGGVVTTLAGSGGAGGDADGVGSSARFNYPSDIAVDTAGNLYVADRDNNTIRVGVPPLPIITSPLVATATVGQLFVYQLEASDADSLDVTSLPSGLSFDSTLGAILGSSMAPGTFQIELRASNSQGTTTATLNLTSSSLPSSGPVIISSSSATWRIGQRVRFQVMTEGASSAARLSTTNLPRGLTADPVTGLIVGTVTREGSFAVTLTVTDGSFTTSAVLQLTFTGDPALPVITSPGEGGLAPGQPFTYEIVAPTEADSSVDPTIFRLIGDLPPGLGFDPSTGTISGTYTPTGTRHRGPAGGGRLSGGIITNVQLFATNSRGTSTTPLVFFLAPVGVLNISTRIPIGTGDNVLIGGFIVTGNAPKKVIIRGIGPSLRVGDLPVPGTVQDPTLELHQGDGALLASNDDWHSSQEQEIIDTTVAPTDDRESAVVATLSPGSYTAVVKGKQGATGIGLVEVYDLGTASLDTSSSSKLANISTRGFVQNADNVMIGGFIVSGGSSSVIVRAIGPELSASGVADALQDTTLEIRDGNGSLINSNDNWKEGGQEQQIIDTTVPPGDDRESAIVAALNPGGYTAIVRGKNDTTGVALVEAYNLQ